MFSYQRVHISIFGHCRIESPTRKSGVILTGAMPNPMLFDAYLPVIIGLACIGCGEIVQISWWNVT